jgi:hypothetical protein
LTFSCSAHSELDDLRAVILKIGLTQMSA